MPLLHEGLILYNPGPADLSVTTISSHLSVLLYYSLTDHDVHSVIGCVACITAEHSFLGRPKFRLIAQYSQKKGCSQNKTASVCLSNSAPTAL